MKKLERYKYTILNHGLKPWDLEKVGDVLHATSPQDAIRRVDRVYRIASKTDTKLSYYARQFLEAVAISADADIGNV